MLVHWPAGADDGVLLARVPDNVYSLARFDAGGALLAGTRQGELFMLPISGKTDETVRRFAAHTSGLYRLVCTGQGLLSCGGDGRIVQWNSNLGISAECRVSAASTRALLAHGSGWLAGSSDHMIRKLDVRLHVFDTWSGHTGSVFALENLPDGRVVSGGRDAVLRVWNEQGREVQTINAHLLHIHDIRLNPSGRWLATASMDKTIKIWDAGSLELLKVIDQIKMQAHRASVNTLLWLDEHTLVSAGDDRQILVMKISDL